MFRIRTVTSKNIVFLSPLVYDEKTAKRKLREMKWLARKEGASMTLVEVSIFPREAIFDWRYEVFDVESELFTMVKITEKKWEEERYDNRENIEEVEEGSA